MYHIFKSSSSSSSSVYYISRKQVQDIADAKGYIEFNIEDDVMTIAYIRVKEQGQGFGTALLLLVARLALLHDVTKIVLDDMSDNAWTERNLYRKLGFKYINPYPEPEMEATPEEILNK